MKNNYINHIVFVIDNSGSMYNLTNQVPKVFDAQIEYLARRSKELDQETRVSVYLFNNTVTNLVYDMDVLRLPSLQGLYRVNGSTALIDATIKALDDLGQTSQLYGDHSFLTYVITDGEENMSSTRPHALSAKLQALPDNWTVAVLVPNQLGVREAKSFGFPADNISIWDTSPRGLEETGRKMQQYTENYMQARSRGVRGTKSLFTLDLSKINSAEVAGKLRELTTKDFKILPVTKEVPIRDFVEGKLRDYVKGNAYYQLTKPEMVQNYKQICVRNNRSGKIYGGQHARNLLRLPNDDVKVDPKNTDFSNFDIFVQSTSVNRKLVPGTVLLYLT